MLALLTNMFESWHENKRKITAFSGETEFISILQQRIFLACHTEKY